MIAPLNSSYSCLIRLIHHSIRRGPRWIAKLVNITKLTLGLSGRDIELVTVSKQTCFELGEQHLVPSGKPTLCYEKSQSLIGKS